MAPLTSLITASSPGFGLELVHQLLAASHKVIATSRNPAKSQELVDSINNDPSGRGRGRWIKLDVTSPLATITQTFAEAAESFGDIDVLISNAGYPVLGAMEDIDDEEAALPSVIERRKGTIVNVGSIAGLDAMATAGVQAGIKFALEAMSEVLYKELEAFEVCVLAVEPGGFRTNVLSEDSVVAMPVSGVYQDTIVEKTQDAFKAMDGQQKWDVRKGVSRIADFIEGKGYAEGRTELLRLPLDNDCYARATKVLSEKLKNVETLKEVALSTDILE